MKWLLFMFWIFVAVMLIQITLNLAVSGSWFYGVIGFIGAVACVMIANEVKDGC